MTERERHKESSSSAQSIILSGLTAGVKCGVILPQSLSQLDEQQIRSGTCQLRHYRGKSFRSSQGPVKRWQEEDTLRCTGVFSTSRHARSPHMQQLSLPFYLSITLKPCLLSQLAIAAYNSTLRTNRQLTITYKCVCKCFCAAFSGGKWSHIEDIVLTFRSHRVFGSSVKFFQFCITSIRNISPILILYVKVIYCRFNYAAFCAENKHTCYIQIWWTCLNVRCIHCLCFKKKIQSVCLYL